MPQQPNDAERAALAVRIRMHLRTLAPAGLPITYQQLATALQLEPPNTIHRVTEALEALMRDDAATGVPFLAALVISKRRNGLPAPGFFECATTLGRYEGAAEGEAAARFHSREFAAALTACTDAHVAS